MRELFQQVLTDPSVRDAEALPLKAVALAGEFLPWLNE